MIIPVIPEGPELDSYQRGDGSWVCHVDTSDLPENQDGPLLTVYINDDIDDPVFDNRKGHL